MGYSFTTIAFRVCLIEQLSQLDTLLQAATTSLNRHTHTHTHTTSLLDYPTYVVTGRAVLSPPPSPSCCYRCCLCCCCGCCCCHFAASPLFASPLIYCSLVFLLLLLLGPVQVQCCAFFLFSLFFLSSCHRVVRQRNRALRSRLSLFSLLFTVSRRSCCCCSSDKPEKPRNLFYLLLSPGSLRCCSVQSSVAKKKERKRKGRIRRAAIAYDRSCSVK